MGDPAQPSLQDAWLAHKSLGIDVSQYGAEATAADDEKPPLAVSFNHAVDSDEFASWGKDSYLTGGFKVKATFKGEMSPRAGAGGSVGYTTNKGAKGDVALAKNAFKKLVGAASIRESKETFNHEFSNKQLKLSLGVKIVMDFGTTWFYPQFTGEFIVAGADWEKLKKDPNSFTLGGIEAGGGGKFQGGYDIDETWEAKGSAEAALVGSIRLNWSKILAEVAKRYALEAAGSAGAAAAVPVAAIAGGIAGGLLLCAGTLKAISLLGEQGRDSTRCAQEGARRLRAYADSYAQTVKGGAGPSAEGNKDGEAYLQYIMRTAQTTREDAVQMCKESTQKYEQLAWVELRPQMREAVKKAYAELHYGNIHGPSLQEYLGDNSDY